MIAKTITLSSTDWLKITSSDTQDDNWFIFWANGDIEFATIKNPPVENIIPLVSGKMFGFQSPQTFYIRWAIGVELYLAPFDWVLGWEWGESGGNEYINAWVNNVAVGGLSANQWPFDTTVQVMLDRILYPFQQMTGSLTTNPVYSTYYEKGVNIAPVTLTASFVKSINPTYPVTDVVFKRGAGIIHTASWVDLTSPQSYIEPNAVEDTTTFSAEITSWQPHTVIASRTLNFVYPMYGGNSDADDYLTWADYSDIEAILSIKRVRPQENTAILDTFVNKRNIFIYPASYPALTSILDWNGFETITNYDVFTKSYTMRDWSSVSYRIYQLKNDTTQTAFTNTYKFS